ncbi:hypothetical protein [Echinicola sp. 20G]|uniref:hypothetical protein n=1 Tax=Echinicola sp. 20G TaxID=2781961 RepID=UPI001910838A|nr:hypothetical protein [Echinicola sp. 20G]
MNHVPFSKIELHQELVNQISEKLKLVSDSIRQLKDSSAEDTKSSAGDKYETGREMIRQEMDKAEKMSLEYNSQLEVLSSLRPDESAELIQRGSLVLTDRIPLYISVGFGKVNISGQEVFVISSQAPLARLMMGKTAGKVISLNGVTYHIKAVQ